MEQVAWAPTGTPATPSPTAATRPANSCPRMTPGLTPAVFAPETIRRSVPQMVLASIFSTTSPGPGSGRLTRRSRSRPTSSRTAAFMVMIVTLMLAS